MGVHAVLIFIFVIVQVVLGRADSTPLSPAQQGTKWGYVDLQGEFVIKPRFDSAGPFSEGLAAVEENKRFGYIDGLGNVVVQPRYFAAGPFKDGLAWVVTGKPIYPLGRGEYGFALFGKVTYIDRTGREIRQPFSAEHVRNFSEGLAAVRQGKNAGGCTGKIGYLDKRGEWSIRPQFDDAGDFSEGLAPVNIGGKCYTGGKWGYIDKSGKPVIPLKYNFATSFKNGKACVAAGQSWMVIDKNGTESPTPKADCLLLGEQN